MSGKSSQLDLTIVHDLEAGRRLATATSGVLYEAADDAQTWACVHEPSLAAPSPDFTGLLTVNVNNGLGTATASMLVTLHYTVPDDEAAEFEAWFGGEHAHLLVEEPAWLSVRVIRGEARDDDSTHLVVHELANASALSSEALLKARATPDRARFAARDWFSGARTRQFVRI